ALMSAQNTANLSNSLMNENLQTICGISSQKQETNVLHEQAAQQEVAEIFTEICNELAECNDSINKIIPSTSLTFDHRLLTDPIDLKTIRLKITEYKFPESFDDDILRIFSNAFKFFGLTSDEGAAAQKLLDVYTAKKRETYPRLKVFFGAELIKRFFPSEKTSELQKCFNTDEDIIRCVCGVIDSCSETVQCCKCMVWQHTQCTGIDDSGLQWVCERCDQRQVDLEISLNEFTDDGTRYYWMLMRGDLQIRCKDTVYILRDIRVEPDQKSASLMSPVKKQTYQTVRNISYSDCDIFRIQRLYKDMEGNRFAFGHNYLRPNETYHKPTQKFYDNEIIKVPVYEAVPLDLIMGRCWVLDPATFAEGRPVGCDESHVYICDLKTDKARKSLSKI
ncbi:Histone-lysine N-methyltransferase ash1, partial [Pseudolycoriella hygida]